jgi:hypothetical protein
MKGLLVSGILLCNERAKRIKVALMHMSCGWRGGAVCGIGFKRRGRGLHGPRRSKNRAEVANRTEHSLRKDVGRQERDTKKEGRGAGLNFYSDFRIQQERELQGTVGEHRRRGS